MAIPLSWEINCPHCKIVTNYKTIKCSIPQKMVIRCEICGAEIDLKPSIKQWNDWLQRESKSA